MATRALHYLFGCSWYLLWACLPKFTLATKNIQENDRVKEKAAKRTATKERKRELKAVQEEEKKERLQLKLKKMEDARMAKEEEKEKKKLKKLQPPPAIHPTVDDLFCTCLERSVTNQVETRGALSKVLGMSTQPSCRSLTHLS